MAFAAAHFNVEIITMVAASSVRYICPRSASKGEPLIALGFRVQDLCESRGGRAGLPVLTSLWCFCGGCFKVFYSLKLANQHVRLDACNFVFNSRSACLEITRSPCAVDGTLKSKN